MTLGAEPDLSESPNW